MARRAREFKIGDRVEHEVEFGKDSKFTIHVIIPLPCRTRTEAEEISHELLFKIEKLEAERRGFEYGTPESLGLIRIKVEP